jgi:hypothetical protein
MTDSTAGKPIELQYGTTAGRSRRRWLWRGIALLLIGCSAYFVPWKTLRLTAEILYYQHQCMTYTAPADLVVCDVDPDAVKTLLGRPGYKGIIAAFHGNEPKDHNSVIFAPWEWSEFRLSMTGSPTPSWHPIGAVAFLHEMRSKSGNRRLVCVTIIPRPIGMSMTVKRNDLNIEVFNIGTLRSLPMNLKPLNRQFDLPTNRVFAGQIDPADSSRFTIRYEAGNDSGTVQGYLRDDDEIEIKIIPDSRPDKP